MSPLLDSFDSSPLPILVYDSFATDAAPILANRAFLSLTRDRPLDSLFSVDGWRFFRSWASGAQQHDGAIPFEAVRDMEMEDDGAAQSLEGSSTASSSAMSTSVNPVPLPHPTEIELELVLGSIDVVSVTERTMIARWRRELVQDIAVDPASSSSSSSTLIVLTALMLPTLKPLPARLTHSRKIRESVAMPRSCRPLAERVEELETVIEAMTTGLARLDMLGRMVWVNEGWYKITGFDRSSSLDEWPTIIDPACLEDLSVKWEHSVRTLQPLCFRFKLKNGKSVLAHALPNAADASQVTGWISNLTDISAAEEAIDELAVERMAVIEADSRRIEADTRRAAAEEQRRQQELLIDVTSHELRQPISAIIQSSELTRSSLQQLRRTLLALDQRGALPPELQDALNDTLLQDIESLDTISDCAMAQEIIANDILGLAQIQINHLSIANISFDLAASLRKIVRMFSSECRTKEIQLSLVMGDSLSILGQPPMIKMDPQRFGQIVINLISNAIRFTAPSPGAKRVTLSLEISSSPPSSSDAPLLPPPNALAPSSTTDPLFLYFQVEDSGVGMDEEETGRLFQRFMQASPLTHCNFGGSGLGLFVCRRLSELQGGRIEVISQRGVGSTFRGFVAAAYSDLSSPSDEMDLPSSPDTLDSPIVVVAAPPPRRVLRVLAVDDNAINRKIVRRQLEAAGHSVDHATNGREAIDMFIAAKGSLWDAVLMDFEMPLVNGLEATKAIRIAEIGWRRSIRIVGLTSNARAAQVEAGLASGMDHVVTKPYRLQCLLDQLEPGA